MAIGDVGDLIDLFQGGAAESEVTAMTADRQQQRLGQAGIRQTVRQADRAALQPESGTSTTPPSSSTDVRSLPDQFRAGVARLGGIQDGRPDRQMLCPQHGVGSSGQQHHDVAVGDLGDLSPGPHAESAAADPAGQRGQSGGTPGDQRQVRRRLRSRAINLVTADPTLPVAPTTATRPCGARREQLLDLPVARWPR